MDSDVVTTPPPLDAEDEQALREALGYLNFASGKPDARFHRHLNRFYSRIGPEKPWEGLKRIFRCGLNRFRGSSAAFENTDQASAVIDLTFEQLIPAYRAHHADLLFGLDDSELLAPLFLARLFEAVLAQGGPWSDTERIIGGALRQLNDFLGHRPVAVLESGQQMQPYDHERFRPIPLYIADAGVAVGRHQDLVARAIEHLRATPADILSDAHFDLSRLDELALDPRAYDHRHPVYKRTNYMFGEWDPHLVDQKGYYRRFVVRSIVLNALEDWMESVTDLPREEVLFEAAAVLCGTMLMASTISGSGPHTYDSSVNLGSLLPKVARQRDAFYRRLLDSVTGTMAERLRREAELARQPFGQVRQHLNLKIANYGARQLQHGHLGYLYAKMGYPEASRREVLVIPSNSARFEGEIEWRLTMAHLHANRGELEAARALLLELEGLLHSGIHCGALADPWNILGFQGNFPLFHAREDGVTDPRIVKLLFLMEQVFSLYSRLLSEAAAEGKRSLCQSISADFRKLAEFWDQFASTTVSGLPSVSGSDSFESATRVSQALAEWRAAGESAGDISFWRRQVHQFETAKAHALVLDILLRKRDSVAAMGLLIQWLSQADIVALESGPYSFHDSIVHWMRAAVGTWGGSLTPAMPTIPVSEHAGGLSATPTDWATITKLFDYLEANAGEYWHVPRFESESRSGERGRTEGPAARERSSEGIDEDEPVDDDEGLFEAAYEGVSFRDSARDGFEGDTLEGGTSVYDTDLDQLNERLEPKLKFLVTLSRLWQIAAAQAAVESNSASGPGGAKSGPPDAQRVAAMLRWYERTRELQQGLQELMESVWKLHLPKPTGDHDSLVDYDRLLQLKFNLIHNIVFTHSACQEASWNLVSCLPEDKREIKKVAQGMPSWERALLVTYRALLRGDRDEVRRRLPTLVNTLSRRPLLYVPLDHGGSPQQLLEARTLQAVIRSILVRLPRLGLLREAWHLLKTAQRMERRSPRTGTVITEFDRLFYAAFRNSLEYLVRQSSRWNSAEFGNEQLIDLMGALTDHYLDQWLEHSLTMRLSSLETLADNRNWRDVKEFISKYGQDFFHAQMLTLGNLRGILHNGVEPFLDYLAENEDRLHPIRLLNDLGEKLDRAEAVSLLELVFRVTVEKFDRFLEYNTTTTQSDYGEQFWSFLEFLRLEASYERQEWNLSPLVTTHEVLVRAGKEEAAEIWRNVFEVRTATAAAQHLKRLKKIEKQCGMRLPGITDLLDERFIKPLTLDRIKALVPQAIRDAHDRQPSAVFEQLKGEIDRYLETTSGSGLDVPDWLLSLEQEVAAFDVIQASDADAADVPATSVPWIPISLEELQKQFEIWSKPLKSPDRKKRR